MLIYLIGFMGSGKSTFGKQLASRLDFNFVDTDSLIEEREGQLIGDIFKLKGEIYFRELERNILKEISIYKNTVVATGGGMPCHTDNIALMNKTGLTIYLRASIDCIRQRLVKEKHKRPLIADVNPTILGDFISDQLEERKPYYQMAQQTILSNDLKIEVLLELVKQNISN